MMIVKGIVAMLLWLAVGPSYAVGTVPLCDTEALYQGVAECVLKRPVASQIECPTDITVATLLKDAGLHTGMRLEEIFAMPEKLKPDAKFGLRVVFRPSLAAEDGLLLATNPHQRRDVEVCKTHEVELYVGRAPFRYMPRRSMVGLSLGESKRMLFDQFGTNIDVAVEGSDIDAGRKIVRQIPDPGLALGRSLPLSHFKMPEQQPVLIVEAVTVKPTKVECTDCALCPIVPPLHSTDPPPSGHDPDLLIGGTGGLVGGLALAKVLRGRGSSSPPAPRGVPPRPLPPTRVRRDIDPIKTPIPEGSDGNEKA